MRTPRWHGGDIATSLPKKRATPGDHGWLGWHGWAWLGLAGWLAMRIRATFANNLHRWVSFRHWTVVWLALLTVIGSVCGTLAVLRCASGYRLVGVCVRGIGFAWIVGDCGRCGTGLLPLLLLQDLWAARRGDVGSAGMTWSAVHGSLARMPCPQSQQTTAVSRTCLARLRYA